MPAKKEDNKPKRRTQVKELPKEEKELSKNEQEKVKGGFSIDDGIISSCAKPKQ